MAMVIHKWNYDDLFSNDFWKNIILHNSVIIENEITNNDIKLLWNAVLNDIREIYFHNDYQLFKYWIKHLKKIELQVVIKLIQTYKSWTEFEAFILKSSSYPDMLEYAEKKFLGVNSQKDNEEWNTEISFALFLRKLHEYPVLILILDNTQIMLSGMDKDKINDAYFQLLQSGYKHVDKIMYQSKFLPEPIDIHILELSVNTPPNYLSLS